MTDQCMAVANPCGYESHFITTSAAPLFSFINSMVPGDSCQLFEYGFRRVLVSDQQEWGGIFALSHECWDDGSVHSSGKAMWV